MNTACRPPSWLAVVAFASGANATTAIVVLAVAIVASSARRRPLLFFVMVGFSVLSVPTDLAGGNESGLYQQFVRDVSSQSPNSQPCQDFVRTGRHRFVRTQDTTRPPVRRTARVAVLRWRTS